MSKLSVTKYSGPGNKPYRIMVPAKHDWLGARKRQALTFETKIEAERIAKRVRDYGWPVVLKELGKYGELDGAPVRSAEQRKHDQFAIDTIYAAFGTTELSVILDFAKRFTASRAVRAVTIEAAVQLFIDWRKVQAELGNFKWRTIADDARRLRDLRIKFGTQQLADITTEQIRGFLSSYPKGPNTRAIVKKLKTFFAWTVKDSASADQKPLLMIDPAGSINAPDYGDYGTNKALYPVDRFYRILLICAQTDKYRPLLAWFVLGGFAGLRSSEIFRDSATDRSALRWENIHLDDPDPECRHILIPADVVKGGTRERPFQLPEGLEAIRAWLPYVPRDSEFVCSLTADQKNALIKEFKRETGLELEDNGLRNSASSYGSAVNNLADMATQLGHTTHVAKKHYNTPLLRRLGKEWFALRPPVGEAQALAA